MAYTIGFAATFSPKAPDPGALYDAAEGHALHVRRSLCDADMAEAIEWLVTHGVIDEAMSERIEAKAIEFTELRLSRVRA